MKIASPSSILHLCPDTGSILSYKIRGEEMCAPNGKIRPLFTIKLINEHGNAFYFTSLQASNTTLTRLPHGGIFRYENLGSQNLHATAFIHMDADGLCHWHLSTENGTGLRQESLEFPQIAVPNHLRGEGGDCDLFWPTMEGLLIRTCKQREMLAPETPYRELGGQSQGFGGFYPGICQMQFMAFYNDRAGLYIAAHDCQHHPKAVEFREENDGIALEFRLFTEAAQGIYDMSYDMITTDFLGDWHDAAEIYRSWMKKNTLLPPPLTQNTALPQWLSQSPVVMIYPVRGNVDTGDMTPNLYFPYQNILPIADRFTKKTGSPVMSLLMHWEGTAPWTPPYVWPPFGGEKLFTDFVRQMHDRGNLVGVYCSGIGWTVRSTLQPDYAPAKYDDESLICRTPDGTIQQTRVIPDSIRYGLDMCPWNTEKVGSIAAGEILSIAQSGCDYAQYFDQNLGGQCSLCYAWDHGHPAGPGLWQNQAMLRLYTHIHQALKTANSPLLLGCEGAAAEPFIGHLPLSDLRYVFGLLVGQPVPAYAYLFHEYLNNFMGNQDYVDASIDLEKNPDCLLFRLAYSFTAGDLLSVTLGDQGNIVWGWGVGWDRPLPNQENVFTLIHNLNSWRVAYAPYLHRGKMVKPLTVEGAQDYPILLRQGLTLAYKSLLTSRWEDENGHQKQVIVNFLPREQTCRTPCQRVYTDPQSDGIPYKGSITIPALSAIWVE